MKMIFFLLISAMLINGCGEFQKGFSEGRIGANEEVAQRLCKFYSEILEVYKKINQSYPTSFQELVDKEYLSRSEPHVRLILKSKPAQGYYYRYSFIDKDHFILEAKPAQQGIMGNKIFKVDESGIVREVDMR